MRVLALSRAAGVVLTAAVIGLAVLAVLTVLDIGKRDRAEGRADAQAFIAKVRTCHRTPPHPTWTACERRVAGVE